MNFLPTFLWSASTFGVFFLPAVRRRKPVSSRERESLTGKE